MERPDVAETLSLLGAMKTCPFRAVDSGCGCSGENVVYAMVRSCRIPNVSIACDSMGGSHEA